jgi:DNA-binding NarL/FixJ family response regulator
MMTTVVIVDDHPVVRAGLRAVLDGADDVEVVATGDDDTDALRLVTRHRPDVLVLDVNLPDLSGLEVMRRLGAQGDGPAVLILTVHDDRQTVFDLLESGADGYVLKDEAPEMLVKAVRAVDRGESWLSPTVAHQVINRATDRQSPSSDPRPTP